jgi:hypothetical protein
MGSLRGSISSSPISSDSIGTIGTRALPVAPSSITESRSSCGSRNVVAICAVIAECEAPVASTNRKGPWPLTITGAQMRPI